MWPMVSRKIIKGKSPSRSFSRHWVAFGYLSSMVVPPLFCIVFLVENNFTTKGAPPTHSSYTKNYHNSNLYWHTVRRRTCINHTGSSVRLLTCSSASNFCQAMLTALLAYLTREVQLHLASYAERHYLCLSTKLYCIIAFSEL